MSKQNMSRIVPGMKFNHWLHGEVVVSRSPMRCDGGWVVEMTKELCDITTFSWTAPLESLGNPSKFVEVSR